MRDQPWVMRTYAGHSSATESNALFRRNLAKGQTGLSVAFDLPTQTGYDPDARAGPGRGRQGRRAGQPPRRPAGAVRRHPDDRDEHLDDDQRHRHVAARALRDRSAGAGRRRPDSRGRGRRTAQLGGTTQNDIVKEYLSRGTYAFPPAESMRLTTDLIAYTVSSVPRWNPINICSYHLQEAGATPVQEIAFAMSTAIAVLDAVRDAGQVPPERFGEVVGADLVLRQRRRAVRRGDVQDARARRALGRDHPRPLRRHRSQGSGGSGTACR